MVELKKKLSKDDHIDDHVDDHVDEEIRQCFIQDSPKSFFTFAGAGSGKTRSLVNTLAFLKEYVGDKYLLLSKHIAVITYTNAACDEILRRIEYDSIFAVSTIHSFLWEQIKNFQKDIKDWVITALKTEIDDLSEKQARSRNTTTQTYINRAEKILKKSERLEKINTVRRFSYNPNGENVGFDSLSHTEVVKIGTDFISNMDTMQEVLASKYPILLIDESQDTKKELIDALLILDKKADLNMTIGMFGDTMQKIYTDGKNNLAECIPENWERPVKIMNHRSAKRIVDLANQIRNGVDQQKQNSRSDAETGTVRLFVANSNSDKFQTEQDVINEMADVANDSEWRESNGCQKLILEHHMAGLRLGFLDIYAPLYQIDSFKTGLLDGSLPELSFLKNVILPLINARRATNYFEEAKIIRQYSPLLIRQSVAGKKQDEVLSKIDNLTEGLFDLWSDDSEPTCWDILLYIKQNKLLKTPERLSILLSTDFREMDEKQIAMRQGLTAKFSQLENYSAYIDEKTSFATHQGIKGLEFPRVLVILDDAEARGFLFSYEKLFGVEELSETDIRNLQEGKDTSIARTTRLFYVACTRAQKSLAILAYTQDKETVKQNAINMGLFDKEEVVIF